MFFLFQPFRGNSKKALVLFGIASLFISSTSAKYIDNFLTSSSLSPFYPSAALTFDKSNFWIRYNDTSFGKAATLANLFLVGSGNGTKKIIKSKMVWKIFSWNRFHEKFPLYFATKIQQAHLLFFGCRRTSTTAQITAAHCRTIYHHTSKIFLKFHFFFAKMVLLSKIIQNQLLNLIPESSRQKPKITSKIL